jgi:Zn-dependent M28 family amino/carboxypeptidase
MISDLRRRAVPFLLAAVMAATLPAVACRGSHPSGTDATAAAQSNTQSSAQRPEPRPEDFDPTPATPAAIKLSGEKAFATLKEFVQLGPRYLGSPGHAKAEQYILSHLEGAQIEQDQFNVVTAAGPFAMNNIIAKFPGKKDGIIVLAGHYDTNLPLKDTTFIGANDGGSDVGLLLEIANHLRQHPPEGYSIWLVFTDGEEATITWTDADSVYGAKHLAHRWQQDGTASRVKAFLLLDMIGDKDLHFEHEAYSTPWLYEVVRRAGSRLHLDAHFNDRYAPIQDDHLPFRDVGIPVVDLIDLDYGFDNLYHHTTQDTPDKCSAQSLQITADVVAETLRALNTR